MSLKTYLYNNAVTDYEGNSGEIPAQMESLKRLCSTTDINHILEIGFNAGHSAEIFLSNSLAHLTSFDLGTRGSVPYAKTFMDIKYPTRHTLILGDSTQTIPEFIQKNPDRKFDLIFIDGGHTYEIATADIMNCKQLSHSNTVVIIDDVVLLEEHQCEWSIGPSKAWVDAIKNNIVTMTNGELYAKGRGICWGTYTSN